MRHGEHGSLWSLVILGVVAAVLAGCGGSSSSTTGPSGGSGGSGASIQGQVLTTRSASAEQSVVVVVLRKALGIGVAEAQNNGTPATPLPDATVELLAGSTVVATTTTDQDGKFEFRNVLPGTYTLKVNDQPVATEDIVVGEGDLAVITGTVTNGTTVAATVTVEARDISGIVQNDAQMGHAINIAQASQSCELEDVLDLREGRRGWGVIAKQCGTHPSVIGLGRSNLSDAEMVNARERVKNRGGRGPKKKA